MKLPEKFQGRHKIRDALICRLWAIQNLTMDEIGQKLGLTKSRIQQIIYENREQVKLDKDYEKSKRIAHLKRLLDTYPEEIGKKSTIDILEQLRKELEGDEPIFDNSKHEHYVFNWQTNGRAIDNDRLQAALAPIGHTRTSGEVQGSSDGASIRQDDVSS